MIVGIVTFFQAIFSSKVGAVLGFGLGVAAAITGAMYYFESMAHENTKFVLENERIQYKVNIEKIDGALKVSEASLKSVNETMQENEKARIKQDFEHAAMQKDLNEALSKITSYRGRWENVASKKPKLLSRIINRSTIKRVQLFQTGTCRAYCDPDKGFKGGAGTAKEAGRDSES